MTRGRYPTRGQLRREARGRRRRQATRRRTAGMVAAGVALLTALIALTRRRRGGGPPPSWLSGDREPREPVPTGGAAGATADHD